MTSGPNRVTIDRGTGTVAKAFPPGDDGARQAIIERDRLARLHRLVDGIDGVTCPRPLHLELEPVPVLTMTLIAGRPMVDHLADRSTNATSVQQLAALLVGVVRAHVDACGEALPDLHFRNMLHTDGPDELVLLDLGDPPAGPPAPSALGPAAACIAHLAGSTLFECTRPVHLLRLRANRATARAAGATLEVAADGHLATRSAMRSATLACYRDIAGGRGQVRRLWYATAGAALAMAYRRLVLPWRWG